jgi:hypothetical protein
MSVATSTPATKARESIAAYAAAVSAIAITYTVVYCAECGDNRSMAVSPDVSERMALDFHALRNHTNYAHGRMVAIFGR